MPCYHPIPALRDGRKVVLHPKPLGSENMWLPCGGCVGCKIARAQEWASRCVHEMREHHSAIFATLTYDDENLPYDGSLVPTHLQLFLKRLRKVVAGNEEAWITVNRDGLYAKRLRFIACGEYGDKRGRPHYHGILFGVGFPEARKVTDKLRTDDRLTALWGKGQVNFGEVTRASAAYVAGYTFKSLGRSYCDADGVVLHPPFMRCSNRPGIGAEYARRYACDFRSGSLVVEGRSTRIPRYYKKKLEETHPDVLEDAAMAQAMRQRDPHDASREGMRAAEAIAKAKRKMRDSHSL